MTTSDVPAPAADPAPPAGWRRRLVAWARRHATPLTITTLVVLATAAFIAPDVFITIGAGEAGVLWRRFDGGTETVAFDDRPFIGRLQADRAGNPIKLNENLHLTMSDLAHLYPYSEGTTVIWPWDRMAIYNIRLQQVSRTYEVLTSDGLDVKAEITIRFKPIEEDLGKLHRDLGPTYIDTLITPLIGAYAREEIARHESDALYSPARLQIQEAIRAKTKLALMSRYYPEVNRESYVIVEDVLIRNVALPQEVRVAVQEKVVQKHLAESYRYRLDRENQEAARKAIEAAGIERFQTALKGGVSDGYLKLRGIEATLELAKSPNTKIVIVGAGKDGVPVILGGIDSPAPPKSN
jgi:regulator of protease activity HflC (stomatin/prohibitin superfamily)